MKKAATGLIIGGSLVFAAGACIYAASAMNRRHPMAEDTVYIDTVSGMKIDTSGVDIKITAGDENSVYYHVTEDRTPDIDVKDGVLTVKIKDKNPYNNIVFFSINNNKDIVEITLDSDTLENVKLCSGSGDIEFNDISFGGYVEAGSGEIEISGCRSGNDITLKTGSGDMELVDCKFGKLTKEQKSGEFKAENVEAGNTSLTAGSGDITLKNCTFGDVVKSQGSGEFKAENITAGIMELTAGSGDTTLTDFTARKVIHESSSGELDAETSQYCDFDITAHSGDVSLKVPGDEDSYNFDLKVSSGDINLTRDDEYSRDNSAANTIKTHTSSGNIDINFR
jgi:DUF4097 and DUF4098 domain-containing protein YvlB